MNLCIKSTAVPARSFSPIHRFGKLEIHTSIPAFPKPWLDKKYLAIHACRFYQRFKKITPDPIRGEIQILYSTVPPCLQRMALPLVGAVTGAPGSAYWKFSGAARKRFGGRRVQELSPTAPSLGNRACSGLRHSLFDIANIARLPGRVKRCGQSFLPAAGRLRFVAVMLTVL